MSHETERAARADGRRRQAVDQRERARARAEQFIVDLEVRRPVG